MSDDRIAAIRARLKFKNLDDFARGYARYISSGGIFIPMSARRLRPVDSTIRFQFLLGDGSTALLGEGRVHRVHEPDPMAPRAPVGLLVRFTKLSQSSKALVDQIVAQKERDSSRITKNDLVREQKESARAAIAEEPAEQARPEQSAEQTSVPLGGELPQARLDPVQADDAPTRETALLDGDLDPEPDPDNDDFFDLAASYASDDDARARPSASNPFADRPKTRPAEAPEQAAETAEREAHLPQDADEASTSRDRLERARGADESDETSDALDLIIAEEPSRPRDEDLSGELPAFRADPGAGVQGLPQLAETEGGVQVLAYERGGPQDRDDLEILSVAEANEEEIDFMFDGIFGAGAESEDDVFGDLFAAPSRPEPAPPSPKAAATETTNDLAFLLDDLESEPSPIDPSSLSILSPSQAEIVLPPDERDDTDEESLDALLESAQRDLRSSRIGLDDGDEVLDSLLEEEDFAAPAPSTEITPPTPREKKRGLFSKFFGGSRDES